MEDFNWVPITVAIIGSGGIGVAGREFFNMIQLAKTGVSGREDKRRLDILSERDYAIAQLALEREARLAAEARYDIERENRRRATEELINMRMIYRSNLPKGNLPEFPDFDDTQPTK